MSGEPVLHIYAQQVGTFKAPTNDALRPVEVDNRDPAAFAVQLREGAGYFRFFEQWTLEHFFPHDGHYMWQTSGEPATLRVHLESTHGNYSSWFVPGGRIVPWEELDPPEVWGNGGGIKTYRWGDFTHDFFDGFDDPRLPVIDRYGRQLFVVGPVIIDLPVVATG